MIFKETKLKGAFIIDPERLEDERGFFARTFCQEEFKSRRLEPTVAQCSLSFNRKKGTLRGMHYQIAPYEEAKLVRCTRGGIYDVALDLRSGSPTFKQWVATEMDAENRKMVYLPKGVAHGFQTLEDNTEVFYQISNFYHLECARGVRWDDAYFKIEWPLTKVILSTKDRSFPDFTPSSQ
jgi:dTDP-4-dehydrorhamnose 3,5-epimerase